MNSSNESLKFLLHTLLKKKIKKSFPNFLMIIGKHEYFFENHSVKRVLSKICNEYFEALRFKYTNVSVGSVKKTIEFFEYSGDF